MNNLANSKAWMKRSLSIALLFVLSSAYMFAQQVTGTVKDSSGDPLVGVNIVVKGTTTGTTTDTNGAYSIKCAKGKTLVFSYIGFISKSVVVKGSKVNVVLSDDSKSLDDVVVIGYGSMQRKDVTSSIITIKPSDMNVSVVTSSEQMLQGKVPGLVITNTSDPNGSASISLRGASSLREGTAMEPYYVIDGVPGVSLSLISPDDIESMDVLRDASATAIYGSKAANGVIIITTKKGKKDGKTNVSYSGYVAVDNAMKTLDMMTGTELLDFADKAGYDLSAYYDKSNVANTDWQKEVLRSALSHNHNVSINGGFGKTSFNASVNYLEKNGVVRGTDMNHLTARSFLQTSILHDHLDLSLSVNASVKNNHTGQTASNGSSVGGKSVLDAMYYYTPLVAPTNADGSWYSNTSISQNYNPLSMVNEDRYNTQQKMIQGIAKATAHIIKGLDWNIDLSYQNEQYIYNNYNSHNSQIYSALNGQASRSTLSNIDKQLETYVNYTNEWNDMHKLNVMLGYSWEQQDHNDGFGLTAYDFYSDATQYYNMGLANKMDLDGIISNQMTSLRMISFYGRINYSLLGRYIFQATVRRDGSSAFGKNNRWGTFPSGSIAWRISQEKFMENQHVFDDLKLRVGYGVSGNSLGFDPYISQLLWGYAGSTFAYSDTENYKTLAATANNNPDLKWERTGMFNVGLDFQVLGGRLSGTIEYYSKNTKDLIYYYPVSTSRYPYSTMTANVGEISNKGIEVSLNAVPVKTRDFSWTTTLNLAHNANKLVKLSNSTYSVEYVDMANTDIGGVTNSNVQRLMEGCPIGQFYTYKFAGYNEDGVSTFYDFEKEKDADGNETGNIVPVLNTDGTQATTTNPGDEDRQKTGSAQPKLTYSWNNNLSWKKWTLSLFFQGTIGNKIFNATEAYYSNITNVKNGKNGLASLYSDVIANPKLINDGNHQQPSDRYIENGSYLRLSAITLAYDFGNISDWIKDLRVYATCNNAFTITGYKGADPEVSLGGLTPGIDWRQGSYPRTRTFLLGVNINF